jgi:hypothetical protein
MTKDRQIKGKKNTCDYEPYIAAGTGAMIEIAWRIIKKKLKKRNR